MSQRRSQGRRQGQGSTSTSSTPPPPPPPAVPGPSQRRRPGYYLDAADYQGNSGRRRRRGYSYPGDRLEGGRRSSDMIIVLCVYHGGSTGWRTVPVSFKPLRTTDEELWWKIRTTYRSEIERWWRRLLLFKRVKTIVPIEFSKNDVPKRQDPKDVPGSHEFIHAYRHVDRIRTTHDWVDWFVDFKSKQRDQTVGLEFIEQLWGEKLAAVAVAATIAIITVSVVWSVEGGNLQTVFTVMGFVLSLAAAQVALIALYYQVSLPG